MIKAVMRRHMIVPPLYLIASALAPLSIVLAIAMFLTIPLAYVVRSSLDPALSPA